MNDGDKGIRIALCMHGLCTGKNDKGDFVSFSKSHDYLKRNIIEPSENVDVFIHTWAEDGDIITNTTDVYAPKRALFEKQILFDHNKTKLHSTRSRWYSYKKVVQLKADYEKQNNFTYDYVLVARFDNCFLTPFSFSEYDSDSFYSSNWAFPHNIDGFLDYWFLSSSEIMDRFSSLYDKMDEYLHNDKIILSNHSLAKHHADKLNLKQKYIKKEHIDFGLERRESLFKVEEKS